MIKKIILCMMASIFCMPAIGASVQVDLKSTNTGLHNEPYYVLYLADAREKFIRTLHVMGGEDEYYEELSGWYRQAKRSSEDIDALTGASLKKGASYQGVFTIDDTYITNGYKIILETVSEDMGNERKEIVITLDASKPIQKVKGSVHVDYLVIRL